MADDAQILLPELVSFTKTWHNKPYAFISPDRPKVSAAGKTIVVAGGETGIVRAIAIAFARAGAASASILGRRVGRLSEAVEEIRGAGQGTEVVAESADFSQRQAAEEGLRKVTAKVGKIDIFIWSAGILPDVGKIRGYSADEFRRGFDPIVMGAFNAIQAVLPLATPDAKIMNVSTGIAHMELVAGMFNYASLKLAVVKLFNYVAAENPGLHVVQIQPGVVPTELNARHGVDGQDDRESSFEIAQCRVLIAVSSVAIRALHRPADVAQGSVPGRKVRLGELGCRTAHRPSK